MIIGLISDTHGLMRAEATAALAGSKYIIHAGDVGNKDVLTALGKIAPVCAVAGNMDGSLGRWLNATEVLDLSSDDGPMIYVLHNLRQLDLDPAAAGFSVVVSGHTHQPATARQGGVLFVNPGSAGPRRSGRPISVGRLHIDGDSLHAELVELSPER